MNRIQKMNEIRSICGYEPANRSFFYRDEIVEIVEVILGRELSKDEDAMSIKTLVATFFPEWQQQGTAISHPSVKNLDYILDLLGDDDSDEDMSEEVTIAEVSELKPQERIIGLAEFILRGINPSFGENVVAVSVSPSNQKQFTITLR